MCERARTSCASYCSADTNSLLERFTHGLRRQVHVGPMLRAAFGPPHCLAEKTRRQLWFKRPSLGRVLRSPRQVPDFPRRRAARRSRIPGQRSWLHCSPTDSRRQDGLLHQAESCAAVVSCRENLILLCEASLKMNDAPLGSAKPTIV
jgi:hypothetical protein